ncbi:hypothetical protein OAF34_00395 [Pirellulaceae bacterium]|jgi:hypothetical protein|nr:hypothetical protein [Pirellulaceae bacterium]
MQILAIVLLGVAIGKSAQVIKNQFYPDKTSTDATKVLLDKI